MARKIERFVCALIPGIIGKRVMVNHRLASQKVSKPETFVATDQYDQYILHDSIGIARRD